MTGIAEIKAVLDNLAKRTWTERVEDLSGLRELTDDWDGMGAIAPRRGSSTAQLKS